MKVRVRLAPSPTGCLHVGTARTALFNYLFAKHHGGAFVLRIEDTDRERSDKKFEKDIIDNLRWLGLRWDEGPIEVSVDGGLLTNQYIGDHSPYRQSERTVIYEKYLKQLLASGYAYYCYCSKEQLETERQAMLTQGMAPKYSGRCRGGKPKDASEPQIIRFRVPEKSISFRDIIRGEITFNAALLGDIAIAKNLQTPLFNFAVVVDDAEMQISHVIRGEDHINNTPKQILFQEALDFPRPHYAHLPLILDPDRSKMSKRFSATTIQEYRDRGYLPEAVNNFLALLGWHPTDDRELFSVDELIKEFDLSRVQKSGAIFNQEKLDWFNSQYIKKMPNERLASLVRIANNKQNLKILDIVKERLIKLSDFDAVAGFFFQPLEYSAELLVWKGQSASGTIEVLAELKNIITKKGDPEARIKTYAETTGRGAVLWPLRVALSGLEASPGPLELLNVFSKEEVVRRIDIAIEKLSS